MNATLFDKDAEPLSIYRIMPGQGSEYADECFPGHFIGADFDIHEDLSGNLPDEMRPFNQRYIPVFLATHPEKSRVSAGLACGALWTVSKGLRNGDIILSPDGTGTYRVGEVDGNYYYEPGQILPHRRRVRWLEASILRSAMSDALRNSCGSIGTISNITSYRDEINRLLAASTATVLALPSSPGIEDPVAFAMERHLEDFLVANWSCTELGRDFTIFEEDGKLVGQQYPSDTGPIDLLAISKDKKRLLVIELKRGRASDAVVGQIARYMGYIKDEIAERDQTVEGAIIALEDDIRIRRALSSIPNVKFYRYKISFKLEPA